MSKKLPWFYWLINGSSVLAIGGVGFLLIRQWPIFQTTLYTGLLTHPVCGCETVLSWTNHPWINIGGLALYIAGVLFLLFIMIHMTLQFLATAAWMRRQQIIDRQRVYYDGQTYRVLTINSQDRVLCSIGWFRRYIIVSTATRQSISSEGLTAALVHEAGHCRGFHAVSRQLMTSCLAVIPWRPLARRWHTSFIALQELIADRFALTVTSRDALLAALVESLDQPLHTTPSAHPGFAAASIRLQALLGDEMIGRLYRLVWWPLLLMVLGGAWSAALVWLPVSATGDQVLATHPQTIGECSAAIAEAMSHAVIEQEAGACVNVQQSNL